MGIAEMGFYFLLVIFFLGIQIFEDLRFRKKIFFFLIQILGIIEKCIGWVLVYPFLGRLFIKSAKKMCICEYVIFGIDTYKKCVFRFEKGYKQIIALGSCKSICQRQVGLSKLHPSVSQKDSRNGKVCTLQFLVSDLPTKSKSIKTFW